MKSYQALSRAALPAAVLFASLSSILIRLSSAPSLAIAFYRMGFAFLMVTPYTVWLRSTGRLQVRKRRPGTPAGPLSAGVKGPAGNKRMQPPPAVHRQGTGRREVLFSLLSGFFLALHFATWVSSLNYTSVASSVVLVNTHPIMVFVISSVILKERHSTRELLFVVLTVAGSAVLSWGDMGKGEGVFLGDLLAIAGALSVGVYLVLGRFVRQTMSLGMYTFLVYGSSALCLLVMAVGADIPLWPYSLRNYKIFFGLAFFCTILGHSVYNWALKYVGSTYLSMNILIEPIAAGVMAFFFFQEIPTLVNGIGAMIVLLGIFGYSKTSSAG
jgi:drug/metabolite transporter (DMT)-like permease